MEFRIAEEQRCLRERSRRLARDFATRAAGHDREASHPVENYAALRDAGFYALNVPTERGALGSACSPTPSPPRSWPRAARRRRCRSTCISRSSVPWRTTRTCAGTWRR